MKSYKQTKAIPPEIIQVWETAWKKCSTEEDSSFDIVMPDRPKAMTFRQHLYTVRERLIEENYLGANNFAKLVISVPSDPGNIIYIKLQPWLKGVQAALEKEGVKPDHGEHVETPVEERLEPTEHVNMLKNLFGPEPTREETHE